MEWVLNWIADGVVVTLLVGLGLLLAPGLSASARCWTWSGTLLLLVGLGVAPWLWTPSISPSPSLAAKELARLSIAVPVLPSPLTNALISMWAIGVVVALTRIALALAALQAVKRSLTPLSASREQRLSVWQAVRRRGRPVRLACSRRMRVPSLLGLGPAVIVLPEHLLDDLSDGELDQIIVHEYAHAQRYDDWNGLGQCLVRAFTGFHPAIRWVDRRLRVEREAACDDWVVTLTGSRAAYARLLTRLAAHPDRSVQASLASGLAGFQPAVAIRVTRLLAGHPKKCSSIADMLTAGAVFSTAAGVAALVPFSFVAAGPIVSISTQVARAQPPSALVASVAVPAPVRPPVSARRATAAVTVSAPERGPADDAVDANAMGALEEDVEPSGMGPLTAVALDVAPLFDARSLELGSIAPPARASSRRSAWDSAAGAAAAIAGSSSRAGAATATYVSRVGSSIAKRF